MMPSPNELKELLTDILDAAEVDPPIMKFALYEIEERLLAAIPALLALVEAEAV